MCDSTRQLSRAVIKPCEGLWCALGDIHQTRLRSKSWKKKHEDIQVKLVQHNFWTRDRRNNRRVWKFQNRKKGDNTYAQLLACKKKGKKDKDWYNARKGETWGYQYDDNQTNLFEFSGSKGQKVFTFKTFLLLKHETWTIWHLIGKMAFVKVLDKKFLTKN